MLRRLEHNDTQEYSESDARDVAGSMFTGSSPVFQGFLRGPYLYFCLLAGVDTVTNPHFR